MGGDKWKRVGRLSLTLLLCLSLTLLCSLGAPPTVWADETGWLSPSANGAVGDGDGFERNPAQAYGDGAGRAENRNNGDTILWFTWNTERHLYYDYDFSIPTDATIDGVEVRLDWWLDSAAGANIIGVDLSWDGGTTWTAIKNDSSEPTSETTVVLGGPADTWGRTWSPNEFSNANFRVRVHCYSSTINQRDFRLDWIPVQVTYTPAPTPVGEYGIVAQAGSQTIQVYVKMEDDGPVILSWEILP